MGWRRALRLVDLPMGQIRRVTIRSEVLLLCRTDAGSVHAVGDLCTHDDGPLGEGRLIGRLIECPRHGAQFDVTDGRAVRMPAAAPIPTFPVRIADDGWIEIEVDP